MPGRAAGRRGGAGNGGALRRAESPAGDSLLLRAGRAVRPPRTPCFPVACPRALPGRGNAGGGHGKRLSLCPGNGNAHYGDSASGRGEGGMGCRGAGPGRAPFERSIILPFRAGGRPDADNRSLRAGRAALPALCGRYFFRLRRGALLPSRRHSRRRL